MIVNIIKDILGYEGLYAVTEDGKVWSYPKRVNSYKGSWMVQHEYVNTKNRITPHVQYTVLLSKDGKETRHQVHRLVAQVYISNPENKPQINHKDGNSLNNHIDNLEWVTPSENMQHARDSGMLNLYTEKSMENRSNNGKLTGRINGAKAHRMFTMSEIAEIKETFESGLKSARAIARELGCSNTTISNICNNKTYQFNTR